MNAIIVGASRGDIRCIEQLNQMILSFNSNLMNYFINESCVQGSYVSKFDDEKIYVNYFFHNIESLVFESKKYEELSNISFDLVIKGYSHELSYNGVLQYKFNIFKNIYDKILLRLLIKNKIFNYISDSATNVLRLFHYVNIYKIPIFIDENMTKLLKEEMKNASENEIDLILSYIKSN